MGEKNVVARKYLSDPERFAQICNNGMFKGRRLILPERLRDLDSQESALYREREAAGHKTAGKKKRVQSNERYRDIV